MKTRALNKREALAIVLLSILSGLFFSCGEEKTDKAPPYLTSSQLFIGEDGLISDSVKFEKTAAELRKEYVFKVHDAGDLSIKLYLENQSRQAATLVLNNDTLTTLSQVMDVEKGENRLLIIFSQAGASASVKMRLIDRINQPSIDYVLTSFAFKTLPPVTRFTVSAVGLASPYEYIIDASASYDGDGRFGGELTAFHYYVDDVFSVSQPSGVLHYVFPGPGSYRVTVAATDNDQLTTQKQQVIVVE